MRATRASTRALASAAISLGYVALTFSGSDALFHYQPENLSLKISANDRYDSTPNGAKPHLVNYAVLLLLKLKRGRCA